jgi:ABC-type ATPase with predicted acetyltransferase domain
LRPLVQTSFCLGVVVGSSGSGKTQALRTIGEPSLAVEWDSARCVADHFPDGPTAMRLLGAAGLNSVPQWLKPHHLLSNGEQYRANLARILGGTHALLLIDEFTSIVDRTVARSLCVALRRFARTRGDIVVASCHFDVLEWLEPSWVLNTNCNHVAHYHGASIQPWKAHVFQQVAELTRG